MPRVFTLSISCEGEIFSGDDEDTADFRTRQEIARILQAVAVKIGAYGADAGACLDLNGNRVGGYEIGLAP